MQELRPTVDDEHIEVIEHLKYLGSRNSADGNCNDDFKSRIGMAKKRMLDLVPIWRYWGINKELKWNYNNIVHSSVRTVLI